MAEMLRREQSVEKEMLELEERMTPLKEAAAKAESDYIEMAEYRHMSDLDREIMRDYDRAIKEKEREIIENDLHITR